MRSRTIKFLKTSGLICILLAGVSVLDGCKKKSEPALPHQHEHQAAEPAAEATATAAAETEQTMCPVMPEMKIDKNVFVEYKGKKVYFCCADCRKAFEADPEKYTDKLPQFGN